MEMVSTMDSGAGAPDLQGLSRAEYATRVLRDRLIVLEIAPGSPIHDEAIGRELGIGRTPVREALKRLESEHLVTMFPRRGTFASQVHISDLAEITEIRLRLEPLAASRAARFATQSDRERMAAFADELEGTEPETMSMRRAMHADLRAHRLVYAANGNAFLEEDLIKYDNLATRIWCLVAERLPSIGESVKEHTRLLRLVGSGEAERAAEDTYEHVLDFERQMRSVLG